jgi:predicted GIY-YIG superfamily endonuclease
MKRGIIYKITNNINGKIYIGQTVMTLHSRLMCHARSQYCVLLKRAIDKYGILAFSIEEIDFALDKGELNKKEIFWINKLMSNNSNVGYNIRGNSESIYGVSLETRKKLSIIAKSQNRIPSVNPTKNPSDELRRKLAKIKGANPFWAYRLDGTFVKQFYSSGQAGLELGVSATHIRKILRGTGKSLGGFFFGHESPKGILLLSA